MQEVKIDFDSTLELVSVRVGCFGFLVKPVTILKGESTVIEKLKSSRSLNPITQEVTDEELLLGANLLMNISNIVDWAKSKTQYQDNA